MARLDGKQIVVIVGQKNYNEEEFNFLVSKFEDEGADVCIASNTLEKALGRLDGYASPDFTIEEINPEEFDAAVIVGGYGAKVYLWDDANTHGALEKFKQSGKVVAAISTAPAVLANAGALREKNATTYPDYNALLILEEQGANLIHDHVITDGNVITASHTRFKEKFAEAIIDKLKG